MIRVAMGSTLAPALANFFMDYHEQTWISNYNRPKVLYYRRYVDDTICVFINANDAMLFFQYLNTRHKNISISHLKKKSMESYLSLIS